MNKETIAEYQECIERANKFYEDVLPQIAHLCIQDFENLNKLGMLLTKLKTKQEN